MKEFKYVITDNEGIHARPAGELVKLAKSFESSVMIEKEGKKADCKKIFGLMGLGAKKDHEVTFTFEGADEEAACEAVSKFMQEKNFWIHRNRPCAEISQHFIMRENW